MYRNKNAQVTIFIILGIIVLGAVIAAIVLTDKIKVDKIEYDATRDVKVFVDECLDQVAGPGILLLGAQGGHIYPIENSLLTDFSDLGYGFQFDKTANVGVNTLPSIEFMQGEINSYIIESMNACIDDFNALKKDITAVEMIPTTTIGEDIVVIDILYPVTVSLGTDQEEKIEKFAITVPIRLGHAYDIANELVASLVEEPEWIDFSQFAEYDVQVNAFPYDEQHFVYSIEDGEFLFLFAAKFAVNQDPEIVIEPEFKLKDGALWQYQVQVIDDDTVTFTSDDVFFPITPEGLFELTPEITGEFDVTIRATDSYGRYDEKTVRFIVEE